MAIINVRMDQVRSGNGNDVLATHGLACCIGIAVVGTHSQHPLHEQTPESKFLAHLADGPMFETNWQIMKRNVQQAKAHGMCNIQATVVVVDTATLVDDEYGCWSRRAILSQGKQNRAIIKKVERLVGEEVQVAQHHINDEKDLIISSTNQISVQSI